MFKLNKFKKLNPKKKQKGKTCIPYDQAHIYEKNA